MAHDEGGLVAFYEKYTDFEGWVEWIGEWGVSRGFFLVCMYLGLYLFLGHLIPSLPLFTFNWLFGTAPIWIPIALIIGSWRVWIWYIQSLYLSGRNPILLEMKVPRDIYKSPRAMEIAFSLLIISSGETTFLHRAWKGQVRPFFSFEIASFGGEIRFFIWCWANYKTEIEAMIYGQYPEVELHQVEDYATKYQYDPEAHAVYCTEWRLETYHGISASDFRVNAFQPKSYIDFELDKDPKEEFKVEPLSTILEFISNIEPEEQIWIQIVLRKCGRKAVLLSKDQDHEWLHMVEQEVERIRQAASEPLGGVELSDKEKAKLFPHPTWKQTEQIRNLERHLGKYPFEIGMRGMYINTSGHMHGPTFTGMRWLWKPLGNPNYMSHLRPRRWHNPFDYPWQDLDDIRWKLTAKRFLDAYRRRLFFHSPWILPTNIVTNETLATLWHPPSRTVATPGLQRIPATKAAAPPNLPV
ncbi:MAG: hypothetical protein JO019_00035 [Candidatus Kaiserbacteria bacterium]|nr:hypothetical protein [Candidatus Kaiserbacteria bacterium]